MTEKISELESANSELKSYCDELQGANHELIKQNEILRRDNDELIYQNASYVSNMLFLPLSDLIEFPLYIEKCY